MSADSNLSILAEPILPGVTLPGAFDSLGRGMESMIKLCKLSTPPDSHVMSLIGFCQELKRLLKCSFVGKRNLGVVNISASYNKSFVIS